MTSKPRVPTVETRAGDTDLHPKALAREEQAIASAEERQRQNKMTFYTFATSTLLGLVSLYPIIRGTRTDNHTMMLSGFIIALVAFKILPVEKMQSLVEAWRGRSG